MPKIETRRLWPWILLLAILASLNGCQVPASSPASEPKWVYTDLRILDDADAQAPDQDLLAGYLRRYGPELQIRLDFLDLNAIPTIDLYLILDNLPGGATELPWHEPADVAWDTLLVVPASGEMQVLAPDLTRVAGSGLRVVRDPVQDTLTISLIADSLPGKTLPGKLYVLTTAAGSTTISDKLGVFFTDGLPPEPAKVLMAFWDTFPAYTPALSLRRWDGAHTGPFGGRHGLYNLLRTARARQVPLALLDLKSPEAISALDYTGGLSMIKEMVAQGNLILPEVLPGFIPEQPEKEKTWLQAIGWEQPYFHAQNQQIEAAYDFRPNPFVFSPAGIFSGLAGSSRVIFTFNPRLKTARLARWQQQLVIELPSQPTLSALTIAGPDLAMRRQLIRNALDSTNQAGESLMVLAEDLPASVWGNPEIARAGFSYLVSHPWIRLMNANDLLGLPLPPIPAHQLPPVSPSDMPEGVQDLASAPKNSLGEAAWQAYASLFAPVYPHPSELPVLREAYSGIAQVFLLAARWVEQPTPINDCSRDIDLDGRAECFLGSERYLAVIQPESGELTFFFAIGSDGSHQLVGPGYQFITGLSDSTSWDVGAGFESDPEALAGAFRDPIQPGSSAPAYNLQENANAIQFKTEDGSVLKNYQISRDGLKIIFELAQPIRYELPLAFDPWRRFSPGWTQTYQAMTIPDGWLWGQKSGPAIAVESNASLQLNSILDSLPAVGYPEDPNQEQTVGHWLPFPMAKIVIQSQDQIWLTIRLLEEASGNFSREQLNSHP